MNSLNDIRDYSMLTEYYEITAADGYYNSPVKDTTAYFDLFFRKVPDRGGFAIMAGLSQVIDYLKNIRFSDDDIDFLRKKGVSPQFLDYLKDFSFSCDVWAVPEGTPIFPNEPIVKVRGPIVEAQLIETALLMFINQQSLIATKANRLVRAAHGTTVAEYGTRRAQGFSQAVFGARAAYIGGCSLTSGFIPEKEFGIPSVNTMIHSWVQMFDSEYEAFCEYAKRYPNDCSVVVDTYDTIRSGIPNAIKAFNDVLVPMGKRPTSIRIDSGDITYLSKRARKMLDDAGFSDCMIVASNSLDEYIITDMLIQGAKVDSFGVGERLITSSSNPVLDGVYKLSAIETNGVIEPKIKISENVTKFTTPCAKAVYRLYDKETGKAEADLMTLQDEVIDESKPYILFDPNYTWKQKKITNFIAKPLLEPIFIDGKCVYKNKTMKELQAFCKEQLGTLWDECLRFEHPHKYYVDLSQKLYDEKYRLLKEHSSRI